MAKVARITPEVRAIQAPAPLRDLPGWCLWRYEQFENEPKPRKVPYYHSGSRRRGQQGSPSDRDQLTTFSVARDAAARKGFDGVGFALLPEWGVCALDFDNVVSDDGSMPAVLDALIASTYVEYSPSGLGVRAFVRGDLGDHKSRSSDTESWGLETFTQKGFVTLTGNVLDEVDLLGHNDTIAPVAPSIEDLCQRRFASRSTIKSGDDFTAGYEPTLGLSEGEAQDLLDAIDPDIGRDDWVRVGMALHHEFGGGEEGFSLWNAWSGMGGKYPGEDALRNQWESFTRRMGPGRKQVTMASVMRLAKEAQSSAPVTVERALLASAALTADLSPSHGACTPQGFEGKFPVTAASDMVAMRPTSWLIKNILPKADLGALFGASGSGKSFVSLDLAMHIARGEDWRGHRVTQGKVVIITAEGGGSYGKRIKAYCQVHGIDVRDLPLGIINAQPNILEAEDIGELTASLAAIGGADLLIIDTLAQVTPGANENASEDMGRAIANAQVLRRATGAMVLLIHHSGKDASRGARGWSGLKGALDVEIEVTRDEETNAREIRLSKMKDEEDGLRYGFALDIVTIGMDEDGDETRSCVAVEAALVEKKPEGKGRGVVQLDRYDVAVRDAMDSFGPDDVVDLPRFMERALDMLGDNVENGRDTRRQNIMRSLRTKHRGVKMPFELSGNAVVFYD